MPTHDSTLALISKIQLNKRLDTRTIWLPIKIRNYVSISCCKELNFEGVEVMYKIRLTRELWTYT